ncbi:MAG: phenylacetate--CoA ligase, partial [Mariniphaga sp.]
MYWEKNYETLSKNELTDLQIDRFNTTLKYAAQSSFYGNLLQKLGISPGDISDIRQIQDFPFTTKQDLRNNFPYGFLTLPKKELIRLHSSSGTTGNPTVIFHNRHDIDSWANLMA